MHILAYLIGLIITVSIIVYVMIDGRKLDKIEREFWRNLNEHFDGIEKPKTKVNKQRNKNKIIKFPR